ncbi:MAG: class I SAM-dependent methyltransferase [Candidatus Odinarchaeia archaeon]
MPEDWEKQWNRRWADVPIWWSILWKGYSSLLKGIHLENPKIVELGCGSGRTSLALARKFKGSVTLVDNSDAALNKAKQVFEGSPISVKLVNGDLFTLKLNEKFDLVHSEGVIEHFSYDDLNKAISVHRDFVKDTGYVIIFVPTPSKTYRIWRFIQEKLGVWYYGDERPMRKEQLIERCEANGLKVINSISTPFQVGVLCQKEKINN